MILPFRGRWPAIHETAFVAPSADVVGDVELGAHSSLWFQTVVRGDVNSIRIGARTNVQDHCVLHVTRRQHALVIGDEVTVGHRATLHGCTIGDRVLIGMGAIVMDGATVGDDCIVGAGALVTPGTVVPSGTLFKGSPAKEARPLTDPERAFLVQSAANYVGDIEAYRGTVPGAARLGQTLNDDFDDDDDIVIDDDEG